MTKPLRRFFLFLMLFAASLPCADGMGRAAVTAVVDDEYDRYKKRGDDYFKEGKYSEARRQYQNCLEVPGFENDAYAQKQIQTCTMGLTLRQQTTDALLQGKGAAAVNLLGQLLGLNPDDAITQGQLADYYEREGSRLFNLKRYQEARINYTEALKYTTTRQETIRSQLENINNATRPPKRIGLKLFTGAVAVGAGAYALLLRSDYQSKLATLNRVGQTVDPLGTNVIGPVDAARQWNEAYVAAEAAQRKEGLYKACIGVAAVATVAELYLLVHKTKSRTRALNWHPSSTSWGLAATLTF